MRPAPVAARADAGLPKETTVTLRRIRVGSAARVAGVMYAILGLVAGIFIALVSMASAGFLAGARNDDLPAWFAPLFGIGAVVIFPILYGVMGLIFGAATAAVYNLVAGMVGGLDLELEQPGAVVRPAVR